MTEAPQRPGPASVCTLVLLGVALFVVPSFYPDTGFLAAVDEPLRPGGIVASSSLGELFAARDATFSPLALATYRLDYLLVEPADIANSMRVQSTLWHVLAAVILLFLLVGRGVAQHRALAGSALFLLHPAVLDGVATAAFRSALLALCFAFFAILAARRRIQGGHGAWLVASGIAAAAAVLAEPVGALVTILLGGCFGAWARRGSLVALALGSAIGVKLTFLISGPANERFVPGEALDPLCALAWPRVGAFVDGAAGSVAPWLAAVVVAVFLLLAAGLRRSYPGLAAAAVVFVLAAVTAACNLRSPTFLGQYLALLGLATLVAHLPLPKPVTISAATAATAACVAVVVLRFPHYLDDRTLLTHVAASRPAAAVQLASTLLQSPLDAQRRAARGHLERAIEHLPEDDLRLRAQRLLVDAHAKLGDAAAASITAEAMCKLGEKLQLPAERMLPLYVRTAECFSVENARKKVDEYFAKARAIAPEHPSVIAADAEQMYVDLVHAVRRERKNPDVDVKPGWLDASDSRLPPIRAKVDAALAKDATCYRGLILKGRIEEATGGVLSAVPLYQKAVDADPKRVEARVLLATLYVANDLPQAAEACVKKALQDGLDDPALHYLLGNIYAVQGRRGDARRYLEIYLRNRPGNRDAMVLLANLLSAEALAQADRLDAKQLAQYSKRIRTLNPQDPKGWLVEAEVLCKSRPRRFVEAIVLLEKAREKMPDNPDVVRRLACAHRDLGWMLSMKKRDLAMDHFKTFLEVAPKGVRTEAVRNAVRAHCKKLEIDGCEHLRTGEAKVAEASFRRSAFLAPDRPEAYFQLGLAQMSQKKLDDALHAFEEAVRLGRAQRHDISHYLLPLLDTLQNLGRAAEAKRRGEAFLANPGNADAVTVARIRKLVR